MTQKLKKKIVKLVVTTQSHAFQGKKWSLSDYVIFGVCRPPQWAKLGGQAMQLGMIFHFEVFGLTCPTNAAKLWWKMSGRGRD